MSTPGGSLLFFGHSGLMDVAAAVKTQQPEKFSYLQLLAAAIGWRAEIL
jgi:hypothetical protein